MNGHVTARDMDIHGGSIYIRDGNKDTFSVTNTGKVTASDMNITGGSIRIKNGNDDVFWVDGDGNAFFSGQVNVSQLVGYVTEAQLDANINAALEHAVNYGYIEDMIATSYHGIYADTQAAIAAAINNSRNYYNATTNGSGTYPEYFSAGHLYIHGYDDSRITNEGPYIVKFNNALYDIQKHTHDFELNKETGQVIIKEADWTGAPHFFNIADTKFFKDAVSAAGGGALSVTVPGNGSGNTKTFGINIGDNEAGIIRIIKSYDSTTNADIVKYYTPNAEESDQNGELFSFSRSSGGGISIDNVILRNSEQSNENSYNNETNHLVLQLNDDDDIEYNASSDKLTGYGKIYFGTNDTDQRSQVIKVEMKASDKPSSGTITHSITKATGNDWTNTAKQYNFTVNGTDAGCVRLYVDGDSIMGSCANSKTELYSYEKLFTISGGVLIEEPSYSIEYSEYESSNTNKKYYVKNRSTNIGYFTIYKFNGKVRCGYYADNMTQPLDAELFDLTGGSSGDGYSIGSASSTFTENGTYYASNDGLDGWSVIKIDVPTSGDPTNISSVESISYQSSPDYNRELTDVKTLGSYSYGSLKIKLSNGVSKTVTVYWGASGSSDPGDEGDDYIDTYDGYGAGNPPSWFNTYQAMGWNARYDGYLVTYAKNNFDNNVYASQIADWEYGWREANNYIYYTTH